MMSSLSLNKLIAEVEAVPISPTSNLNRYIITATDYATMWAEAKASVNADAHSTAKFLYENVITRFGCPLEIISNQGSHFLNEVIAHLLGEFMVTHRKSSPYYPWCNEQVERTNKVLCAVLTKIIAALRSDWSTKLQASRIVGLPHLLQSSNSPHTIETSIWTGANTSHRAPRP